jgi:hypothetical protein
MSNVLSFPGNTTAGRMSLLSQLHQAGAFYDVKECGNYFNGDYNEMIPTGKKTLVNANTGEPISVMSQEYVVVQNEQIFAALDRQIAASGLNLTGAYTNVVMQNNGGQVMVQYIFPAHSVDVGNGDTAAFMITAINSFNGTCAFVVYVGAFRGYCRNGQVFGTGFIAYRKQHCKGLNIDRAADTIRVGIDVFMKEGELWKQMTKRYITEQQAYVALADMAEVDVAKYPTYAAYLADVQVTAKRTTKLENYVRIFQEYQAEMGTTEFALYNTITAITTHGAAKAGERVQAISTYETRAKKAQKICATHIQSYREAA